MSTSTFAKTHNLIAFLEKPSKDQNLNDNVWLQGLINGKKVVVTEASIRHDLKLNDAEDLAHKETVLSMQDVTDANGKEVAKEMVKVITTAKIIVDEVSTAGGDLMLLMKNQLVLLLQILLLVNQESTTRIASSKIQVKDKGKVKLVEEHEVLKSRKAQIAIDEEEGLEMDAERIKALRKRIRKEKVEKDQTAKKQKGDELEKENIEKQKMEEQQDAKELKRNLEIMFNEVRLQVDYEVEMVYDLLRLVSSYSKTSHLHAVKRIFRYFKGQPKLGLWNPRDSPFDLEAYSDSDYEDRMERAATTTSSLEAEQDSGNINRTQSMATLNEPFPQGTSFGSGPSYQVTILGSVEAQTRFEAASKQSNNPPLSRGHILGSGEDSIKLKRIDGILYKIV
nr:uncharacterized mitochondrial protein AtMg00810-like [Tanacetum cinerariifolium]